MDYPDEKRCSNPECTTKKLSEFDKKKDGRYGTASRCKSCSSAKKRKKYREDSEYADKAKARAKKRQNSPETREGYLEYQRSYHKEHQKELVDIKRLRRNTVPGVREGENASQSRRYYQNPKLFRDRIQQWSDNNPDKVKDYGRKRDMSKRGAYVPGVVQPSHERVLLRDGSNCINCNVSMNITPWDYTTMGTPPTNSFEIEHLIPIDRGGKDIMENVQAWCHRCNHEKGNLTIFEFRNGLRPKRSERGNVGMDHPFDF